MKPEMPLQSFDYEQKTATSEIISDKNVEKNIDSGIDKKAERYEQRSDTINTIANDAVITTILPTPVTDNRSDDIVTTIGSIPLVANDDDLIEKEWVDKAKKIIADTYNNPHQREQAVSELQTAYLKKRYGKELSVTE